MLTVCREYNNYYNCSYHKTVASDCSYTSSNKRLGWRPGNKSCGFQQSDLVITPSGAIIKEAWELQHLIKCCTSLEAEACRCMAIMYTAGLVVLLFGDGVVSKECLL